MPNTRLIEWRKSMKCTQEEMATRLGVSQSFYQKIEGGERNPSFNFIAKFKQVFPDCNTDDIFFGSELHEGCKSAV